MLPFMIINTKRFDRKKTHYKSILDLHPKKKKYFYLIVFVSKD